MENVKSGDEEEEKKARTKENLTEGRRRKKRKRRRAREKEDKHVTTLKQMGIYKSLKSAGVPPDLARQFVSRHLCTAFFFFFFFFNEPTEE